jgi:tRNA modification GTPase
VTVPADTIVALSSGRPPAAIAVIRMSGARAGIIAAQVGGRLPAPRTAALRDLVDPRSGQMIDRGLVVFFPAPHSATGENIVEFQCHGGRAVIDRLLSVLLAQSGVRLAEPGEFTRRALAGGRIDLTEAEGLADLLSAETELQRRAALARADGTLRHQLEAWRARLLRLSAAAEVAIDYADEEDGFAPPPLAEPAIALAEEVRALLAAPRIDSLRDGLRIVFAGPPNAGKSSLVNALAKSDRAIVTAVPGTTRDSIEVPLSVDGLPLVLVDTAGLRQSDDEVERIGVGRAEDEVAAADLVLWLGAPGESPQVQRLLQVAPKCDLPGHAGTGLAVSAKTGEGLESLLAAIAAACQALVPAPRQLSLTIREADLASKLAASLERASVATDPVVTAEELRLGRVALDSITGRAGIEDVLDQLFGRFCLGK